MSKTITANDYTSALRGYTCNPKKAKGTSELFLIGLEIQRAGEQLRPGLLKRGYIYPPHKAFASPIYPLE